MDSIVIAAALQRTAGLGQRRLHLRADREGARRRAGRGDAQGAAAARPRAGGGARRRTVSACATARPSWPRRGRAKVDVDPPAPVALERRAAAAEHGPFLDPSHPYPSCFVCGPHARGRRRAADLRRAGRRREAVSRRRGHRPPTSPAPDGVLPEEIVWAALDCPTSGPVANDGDEPGFMPIVLGRLAARIDRPVMAGEPHVILAWEIGIDGRKRHSAAALFSRSGAASCRAVSQGTLDRAAPDASGADAGRPRAHVPEAAARISMSCCPCSARRTPGSLRRRGRRRGCARRPGATRIASHCAARSPGRRSLPARCRRGRRRPLPARCARDRTGSSKPGAILKYDTPDFSSSRFLRAKRDSSPGE